MLGLSSSTRDLHCSMKDPLLQHEGSLVVTCGLLSCSMHVGSSSLTRDRTQAHCTGSAESYLLDHQGSPKSAFLNRSLESNLCSFRNKWVANIAIVGI